MVQSKILKKIPSVEHYFLNRRDYSARRYNGLIKKSVSPEQVHSNKVVRMEKNFRNKIYTGADGLIADFPVSLLIKTADCLPVFICNRNPQMIIALHTGWRGLLKGIIDNIKFSKLDKSGLSGTFAAIGPHIRSCCYKVENDVFGKFKKLLPSTVGFFRNINNDKYLDLSAVAIFQLVSVGLAPENIDDVAVCTSCDPAYYSYRRDKTDYRNFNLIKLKNG
ncbi:hypothetical protein A3B48_00365 [Candidatus Gottesmanbacteria bacterium RIFCSPLOWO2_01_FULL_40_10]|uniref:Purine nucleoside phosphorylase n=1 Tax=Candidatus Gottesmanbacteria bacterium RIFCSPHIGHO2_01_FULL_40_15 TaxID=1798376 RepID=A0A1F5Z2W5_9BACT|nr:MAG: hypothetical protein A2777_06015 [Candidatus Gottesmanbacteria bacterium RIFCSPHIGHO2_01_FULL_40_15]OGG23218.1 MAG: hypothetical protein A3B48_00365 [Candidatus Gottesmanbacteria bacterium RIFCSPLOWO2_01_FULL_40_10]OGG25894.1 MAG: hypothetical protein A3E42_06260 [Candidatus Gottesmanbacteria bacterium RIFCSPHIGHO2_12_FULL_40_13]OGG32309.1 MAG: hypothetical protein A3I80_03325 [Candidatus Gottesmanbacteria bacterium RIFCSPLOWO2_02_FULL_40_10]